MSDLPIKTPSLPLKAKEGVYRKESCNEKEAKFERLSGSLRAP